VVDAVKARLDVGLYHPRIRRRRVGEVDDLGDGVLGTASRSIAVGGDVEVGLEDRLQHQLEGICTTRSRRVGIPRQRILPLFLGMARSLTGSGRNVRSRSDWRSSLRNRSAP
jgi:hypothetical protein